MKSLTEQIDFMRHQLVVRSAALAAHSFCSGVSPEEVESIQSVLATLESLREQSRSNEAMRPEREF